MSTVEITHPDKLLFPDDGITKEDLASYYERVSEWMLPHIKFRPISMQRFPDGIGGKGFFHKDVPDYFPAWLRRVEVPKSGGTVTHVYACDADTLVYLVGQNTITPHVWLSRVDRPWQPDRMVIDLDPPPGVDFNAVRRAARQSGELLRELGFTPFAQVTGSKGIHVWTPLRRRAGQRRGAGVRARPRLACWRSATLTTSPPSGARRSATAASSWTPPATPTRRRRCRPTRCGRVPAPPWQRPIDWDELSDSKLRPDRWTIKNVLRRLGAKGDPWADIASLRARDRTRPPPRRVTAGLIRSASRPAGRPRSSPPCPWTPRDRPSRPRTRSRGTCAGRSGRSMSSRLPGRSGPLTISYSTPASSSAFCTFQHGWPLSLTQTFGQRWRRTAMGAS